MASAAGAADPINLTRQSTKFGYSKPLCSLILLFEICCRCFEWRNETALKGVDFSLVLPRFEVSALNVLCLSFLHFSICSFERGRGITIDYGDFHNCHRNCESVLVVRRIYEHNKVGEFFWWQQARYFCVVVEASNQHLLRIVTLTHYNINREQAIASLWLARNVVSSILAGCFDSTKFESNVPDDVSILIRPVSLLAEVPKVSYCPEYQ